MRWLIVLFLPNTARPRRFANYQIRQEFEGKNWFAILDCSNEPHCRAITHFLSWHANCRQSWSNILRNRQVVETHDRHISGNRVSRISAFRKRADGLNVIGAEYSVGGCPS